MLWAYWALPEVFHHPLVLVGEWAADKGGWHSADQVRLIENFADIGMTGCTESTRTRKHNQQDTGKGWKVHVPQTNLDTLHIKRKNYGKLRKTLKAVEADASKIFWFHATKKRTNPTAWRASNTSRKQAQESEDLLDDMPKTPDLMPTRHPLTHHMVLPCQAGESTILGNLFTIHATAEHSINATAKLFQSSQAIPGIQENWAPKHNKAKWKGNWNPIYRLREELQRFLSRSCRTLASNLRHDKPE